MISSSRSRSLPIGVSSFPELVVFCPSLLHWTFPCVVAHRFTKNIFI